MRAGFSRDMPASEVGESRPSDCTRPAAARPAEQPVGIDECMQTRQVASGSHARHDDRAVNALDSPRERAFSDPRQDRRQPTPRGNPGRDLPWGGRRTSVSTVHFGARRAVSPRRCSPCGAMARAAAEAIRGPIHQGLSRCAGGGARGPGVRGPASGSPHPGTLLPRGPLAAAPSLEASGTRPEALTRIQRQISRAF